MGGGGGVSEPAARRAAAGVLDRAFALRESGTDVRTELLAGLTTFLTMAYIVFINPAILGDAGMPKGAVFVATCLVAAAGTLLMAGRANYPIAVAPGMGLNAYFAYVVVLHLGYTWQAALGAVFFSGCCFLLVSLVGIRDAIIVGIPLSLRKGITVGIGLFLAMIALKNAGIVAADPATYVTLGDLHAPGAALAVIGFLVAAALSARRVKGALLASILAVTILSFFLAGNSYRGVVSPPPSIAPTLLALDLKAALAGGVLNIVLVFFLVELFDATGTLMAVAGRAGLIGEGKMHRLSRALVADSGAILLGSLLGTSSATAYLESMAGVQEGGRTGLAAVTVAALFLACLFFAPLAGSVPPYATAPALFYVACLMLGEIDGLDWRDPTEVVPAALTMVMMPLTFSIANGIGFGFIAYAALKALGGRGAAVSPAAWIIAAVFVLRFAFVRGG